MHVKTVIIINVNVIVTLKVKGVKAVIHTILSEPIVATG